MAAPPASLAPLAALSPLDGRYAKSGRELCAFFSEEALIKRRLRVQTRWVGRLLRTRELQLENSADRAAAARAIEALDAELDARAQEAAVAVAALERTTRHDLKAAEYFLRGEFQRKGLGAVVPLTHFGCTSEDVNNLARSSALRDASRDALVPLAQGVLRALLAFVENHADTPMLALTHGQPASPTTFGKEIAVTAAALAGKVTRIRNAEEALTGKVNGATGNYNALAFAVPGVSWSAVCRTFVEEDIGLRFNPLTTQIEGHHSLVEYLEAVAQFNDILMGLCRDLWMYISLGRLRLARVTAEVGSSTMPHKVNPIDFENAEGNIGVSNALLRHLAAKLPISRMQRDLSDSTALRNVGVALGHAVVAWRSFLEGCSRVEVDGDACRAELAPHYELLMEALQTVLRFHGSRDAYEAAAAASKNARTFGRAEWLAAVEGARGQLPAPEAERLQRLTPETYVGRAPELARDAAEALRAALPPAAEPRENAGPRRTRVTGLKDLDRGLGWQPRAAREP